MFTRADIMKQALEDPKSIKSILPKGVSVIGRGVKIQQFDKVQILNMGKGGDYLLQKNMNFFYLLVGKKGVCKSVWVIAYINLT